MSESFFLYLNYTVFASFLVTLVALPFMVINMVRAVNKNRSLLMNVQRWNDFPIKSVVFFVGSILVGMFLSTVVSNHARSRTLDFLESLPNTYTVLAEGCAVTDGKNLIAALKTTHSVMGHHSHPIKTIHIDIHANGQVLHLNLGRDSQVYQEYWVFYPGYRVSSDNDIGRITTNTLDRY